MQKSTKFFVARKNSEFLKETVSSVSKDTLDSIFHGWGLSTEWCRSMRQQLVLEVENEPGVCEFESGRRPTLDTNTYRL